MLKALKTAKLEICSMAEVVRSSFNVCGEHVKVTNKREHTKRVHQMTIAEYKSKFNLYYYDLCM